MKTTVKLSKHFTLNNLTKSETAERLNIKNQNLIVISHVLNLQRLCIAVLNQLKEKFDDMEITSGWRCKELNDKIGGVINSQHLVGQAVDIICNDIDKMWNTLKLMDIDQAIRYNTYIHVSYIRWNRNRNQYIDKTLKTERR